MGNSITKSTKQTIHVETEVEVEEEEEAVETINSCNNIINNTTNSANNPIRFSTSLLSLSTFANKFLRSSSTDDGNSNPTKPTKSQSFSIAPNSANDELPKARHQVIKHF